MRAALIVFLIFIHGAVAAQQQQSRSELEKQRQQLLLSIKETEEQLEATRKDQKATLSQLRTLQARLNARKRLINNINQEIDNIDRNIQMSSKEVNQLQARLEQQQARYAQSIRYAYKHRNSYNTLAFIFSAEDYNDVVRRMKYLKKFRDYRKEQVEEIKKTQARLEQKIGQLNTQKSHKSLLLTAEEQQRLELEKESQETNTVVKQLKGREKELAAAIERNRRAARQVDQQINKIIQREIELARKKAEEERKRKEEEERKREEERRKAAELAAKTQDPAGSGGTTYGNVKLNTGSGGEKPTPKETAPVASTKGSEDVKAVERPSTPARSSSGPLPYSLSLTPEVKALSNSFEANKGKLPWPVEKGFIALGFGPYKHPTEPRITLDNAGVSINTGRNAVARAVFDGTVSSSFYVAGAGWTIVVSHGQFYTVYSGLSKVNVEKGQAVTIKQPLGIIGENEEGVPVINFQVWKVGSNNKSFKINPAEWIAR